LTWRFTIFDARVIAFANRKLQGKETDCRLRDRTGFKLKEIDSVASEEFRHLRLVLLCPRLSAGLKHNAQTARMLQSADCGRSK
jgi:hypothetical protein